jgi:hypothetical protein
LLQHRTRQASDHRLVELVGNVRAFPDFGGLALARPQYSPASFRDRHAGYGDLATACRHGLGFSNSEPIAHQPGQYFDLEAVSHHEGCRIRAAPQLALPWFGPRSPRCVHVGDARSVSHSAILADRAARRPCRLQGGRMAGRPQIGLQLGS